MLGIAYSASAQTITANAFTRLGVDLPGVRQGSSDWGDYDGDGDPDLVVTGRDAGGNRTATIYRNDGGGTFTDISAGLPGVQEGSSDWGDYDNDGDLDLFITGLDASNSRVAAIYRNDGGGTFTDISAGLTGVGGVFGSWSSSDWGDYDNDGDLDLVVTGLDRFNDQTATIYRNDGGGTFTDISAGLTGVQQGSSDWGDYDNDGDLDLIITGLDASNNRVATIYRNNGGGTFANLSAGLIGVHVSSSDWGDYDNDGDLDLVVTGRTSLSGSAGSVTIYRNDGGGTFTDISAGLTGVEQGSSDWGDYDGDGDLDLVVAGIDDNGNRTAVVYRNDGGGTFADLGAGLTGVRVASSGWGDYDGDGDPDLVITGFDIYEDPSVRVYVNRTTQQGSNQAPRFVRSTGKTPSAAGTTSHWLFEAGDPNGDPLTFQLVADGGISDAVLTDQGNGVASLALTPSLSQAGQSFSFTVEVDDGDGLTATRTSIIDVPSSLAGRDAGLIGVEIGSSDWGDYDGDGDLDLAVTGLDASGNRTAAIYRNDGGGTFTDISAGLTSVREGSSDWGDYDGDGDLDLFMTGRTGSSPVSGRVASIYRNDGGGTFTDITDISAGIGITGTGVDVGSGDWGDYDGDGDLDLVVTGRGSSFTGTATIYENDVANANGFTDIGAGLTGVQEGSSDWGDYDGDGDLDLVVTGIDGSFNRTATIYENDVANANGFTDIGAGLTGVQEGSSDWGDYDGDGDLDLAVTGRDGSSNRTATIYENLGGGVFNPINAGLTGVTQASSKWGDYDNDGDLDLFVAGLDASSNRTATIYRNDGGGAFNAINAGLTGARHASSSWGDYDGDSDLDLIVTGENIFIISTGLERTPATTLYENLSMQQAVGSSATASVSGPGLVSFAASGLSINFASGTTGPGNVSVARFDDAPTGTGGLPSGSNASSYRVVITADADLAAGAGSQVRFDVSQFGGITAPGDITVYSRPGVGVGSFAARPTTVETTGGTTELVATVDGFSEFVFVSASQPLPVELSAFNATLSGENAVLVWETNSETNNAGFQVQRAVVKPGGTEWEALATVDGSGTTDTPQSYRFIDTDLPYATDSLSYRLRQIDVDGTETITEAVTIARQVTAAELLPTYPNPVHGQATIRFAVPERQDVRIALYDLLGRRVQTVTNGPASGRTEQVLDMSRLPSGTYFLRMQAGHYTATQRVTVVR